MNPKLIKIEKFLKKAVKLNKSYEEMSCQISKIEQSTIYRKEKLGKITGVCIFAFGEKLFYFEGAEKMSSLTRLQKELNKKYCPPPFYVVGEGYFRGAFYRLKNQKEFDELIFSIFDPLSMATVYNQMFCQSSILSKHKSTIFESLEAYWVGMDYICVDSLIMVLEGSLRDLIEHALKKRPALKFQTYIRSLAISRLGSLFEELKTFYWYPFKCANLSYAIENSGTDEETKLWVLLDHTMDAISAFLVWFSDVLYKMYPDGTKEFHLSRHNMVHAFSPRKAVPVYYPLMYWSLLSIYYVESLFLAPKSGLFPTSNDEDRKLEQYFKVLAKEGGYGDMRRNMAKRFGVEYGRSNDNITGDV